MARSVQKSKISLMTLNYLFLTIFFVYFIRDSIEIQVSCELKCLAREININIRSWIEAKMTLVIRKIIFKFLRFLICD